MSHPQQFVTDGCGLEMAHDPHPLGDPEDPGVGWCAGQAAGGGAGTVQARTVGGPPATLGALFAVSAAPRGWALWTLPAALAEQVLDQLQRFADHLNATHAVAVDDLVLGCWRLHPNVVADLAQLHATWAEAHTGLGATPSAAADWHDRRLPAFYSRLRTAFGDRTTGRRCGPSGHAAEWRPAAGVADQLVKVREGLPVAGASVHTDCPAALAPGS